MRYKRKEGFRYSFKQPLEATLNIVKINEKAVKSNQAKPIFTTLVLAG
ncbi:hypothetical protein [Gracilibacillus boraciitolerans]|nr:hypothetical protein [Gracilibacillus boraciitolerans]